eukprot:GHRR01010830.1.p2 GENE.GHRR01010830.1~~GHRR01010830.1.p2  ORF type:complete len:191 (+),score=111.37 GHRR01010830.1:1003-1575(+)
MVWPYIKQLRKWIKKRQYNNPDWDMPVAPEQAANPPLQAAPNGAGISMHQPYYPQQVQKLLTHQAEQQQQQLGPQLPEQQQRPREAISLSGLLQQLQKSQPQKPASRQNSAGSSSSSSLPGNSNYETSNSVTAGRLAALLGAAAAAAAATASTGEVPGNDKGFRFDRQAILHALHDSTAARQQSAAVVGR